MKGARSGRLTEREQAELDDALAAIIASTKRVSRKLNLLEIAARIDVARKYLGRLGAVAFAVGLSPEMLRQFTRVTLLSPEAKRLIRDGRLASVDMCDRISRLPKEDQGFVARLAALGQVDSTDVRAVLAQRKMLPKVRINEIVRQVTDSKNVREYVLQFLLPDSVPARVVRSRLLSFLGKDAVRSLEIAEAQGEVTVTEKGRNRFESAARSGGLSKRELLSRILRGEATVT